VVLLAAALMYVCLAVWTWTDDGCYQRVRDDGKIEVMLYTFGSKDTRVGLGDTPEQAWTMAARACGDEP
jgi:hypothetical protein